MWVLEKRRRLSCRYKTRWCETKLCLRSETSILPYCRSDAKNLSVTFQILYWKFPYISSEAALSTEWRIYVLLKLNISIWSCWNLGLLDTLHYKGLQNTEYCLTLVRSFKPVHTVRFERSNSQTIPQQVRRRKPRTWLVDKPTWTHTCEWIKIKKIPDWTRSRRHFLQKYNNLFKISLNADDTHLILKYAAELFDSFTVPLLPHIIDNLNGSCSKAFYILH